MNRFYERQALGELHHDLYMFTELTWKISRTHILPNNVDYDVQSSPFIFAGATWILHIWPYGHAFTNSIGWIDLGIERIASKIPEHVVFCKFYFKTHRGKEFEPFQDSFTFDLTRTVNWLMYTEKLNFYRKEKTVVKDGFLTIVCQIRTPKISGIEVFSQTELLEPVARTSEEKSIQVSDSSATNGTSEENSIQVSDSSATNDSSEEKSKPDPKSSTSVCKACDCTSCHPMPLHFDKMLKDFKELFVQKEDCDVVINVQGQEFPAHKAVIRARSPVLASAFRYDMKEKATNAIDVEDCDPSSFSDFLSFLYFGNVDCITVENVFSLFTTADKYDVQDLRSQCIAFMKDNLSVDTFVDTVIVALQHVEKDLIALTTDFFAKNQLDIIVTVKWQSFLVANPIQSNEIVIKALVSNKK